MKLTELEKQVLLAIITNEFQSITNGDTEGLEAEDVLEQSIWYLIHSDVKHIKGFENHKTLSGVMASLVKKELAGVFDATKIGEPRRESTCWITQKGFEIVKEFIK